MRLLTILLLLVVVAPATAQEQEIRNANLPRELEWELIRMYDGDARRIDGEEVIARGEVVRGDVAATGGPLRIAGRVVGDVAMVGGDVILASGGSITGSLMVIGGQVELDEGAEVGGTITAYAASDRSGVARRDRPRRDRDDSWWDRRRESRHSDRGFSRLTLRMGPSYNRVEGLPLMFGPVVQTAGPNPFRVEALAIWRTEAGASLDTDRMGYQVKAQQFFGGERRFSVGASAYSIVDPLDRWQISDLEASLATALFHDDYRDHYDRSGWSAFVEAKPIAPLTARMEYRSEAHEAVPSGDPWSLFNDGDAWRPQPLVAEGDIRSVIGSVELDYRDDVEDPVRGWYGRLSLERPVSGELVRPALGALLPYGASAGGFDPAPTLFPATPVELDFTSAHLDVRRYTPVGWASQLNIRVVAGGSVTERSLPPQFQHALGGIGSLPGFETFYADCGMRALVGSVGEDRYFPAYGCDRFALGQVEYRGDLSLDFGFGEPDYDDGDWWDDVDVDLSPTWVVFFDAARGWAYPDPAFGPERDTGTLYDVGVGFLIDKLGFYAALPLNGSVEQEPRFFIRLGRRF